jgi:hypothetical protein
MTSDMFASSPWAEHASSDTTAQRAEADRAQHDAERLKAVRVVAATAHDTDEARRLLSMLGLDLEDVRSAMSRRVAAA